MRVPLDIHRLRHFRNSNPPPKIADGSKKQTDAAVKEFWKGLKNAIDEIGGTLLHSGLVQAMLLARSETKKEAPKKVLLAISNWFESDDCPVKGLVETAIADLKKKNNDVAEDDQAGRLIVALMLLDSTSQAMAIQAEAIRYLGRAKLLAKAFAGDTA